MPPPLADADSPRVEDEPPSKKVKLTTPPAPLYGSQEYWDARYRQHQVPNVSDNGQADDEAMPYHAWYFTYSDLRPLILPLLLGGKNTGKIDGDLFDGESDQFKMTEQDTPTNDKETASNNTEATEGGISDKKIVHEENKKIETSDSDSGEDDENNEDQDDGLIESCEFVEVDESDDDSDGDESHEREGLARDGPVSVLEIGCGDMPLGADLAIELISLQKKGATKVDAVIKKIVCCDYSPTVVAMLSAQKQESKGLKSDDLATLDTILEYQEADARKMPQYQDRSVELVLEKGTLDAMLSDKETGVANCIEIVKEIARVLTIGGYIVLVSHLNAHTKNGIEWLHEVILPGLRTGGRDATWEIEVHGNDGSNDIDNGKFDPPSSPGPCVYIIHKMDGQADDEGVDTKETPTIPLSFFTY
jgi:SAM-dependent methyltransferase